jgi:hypothetical protein
MSASTLQDLSNLLYIFCHYAQLLLGNFLLSLFKAIAHR